MEFKSRTSHSTESLIDMFFMAMVLKIKEYKQFLSSCESVTKLSRPEMELKIFEPYTHINRTAKIISLLSMKPSHLQAIVLSRDIIVLLRCDGIQFLTIYDDISLSLFDVSSPDQWLEDHSDAPR